MEQHPLVGLAFTAAFVVVIVLGWLRHDIKKPKACDRCKSPRVGRYCANCGAACGISLMECLNDIGLRKEKERESRGK